MSTYMLNFGPQHPAAHGVLRLVLELKGEKIINSDPHIGFLHRGTEKLIESKTYFQSLPYFDRLDYVSMLSQEHGFVLAVEHLLNLKISKKVKIIRTMMDEVTRLLNHIMCITTHALDVGALTPFLWGFEEREKLISFYEKLSGARMHAAYYRIGGISFDIPDQFLLDLSNFTKMFYNYLDLLNDILSTNPIWFSRLHSIGILSKKDALSYGCSGPTLRGSGLSWDVRKTQPYEYYSNLKFNIPVGKLGDSYSRYFVRFYEMLESLNIINQCIDLLLNLNFPKNTIFENNELNLNNFFSNYTKNSIKYDMESLIQHFKHFSEGFNVKYGNFYSSIEAPKGETGVYIFANNTNKPLRCKIKSPGFLHLQALNLLSQDLLLADLVTNIGSLDIVFGEIDR